MDKVDATLATFLAELVVKLQAGVKDAPATGVATAGRASIRTQLQQLLGQELEIYKTMGKSTAKIVLSMDISAC